MLLGVGLLGYASLKRFAKTNKALSDKAGGKVRPNSPVNLINKAVTSKEQPYSKRAAIGREFRITYSTDNYIKMGLKALALPNGKAIIMWSISYNLRASGMFAQTLDGFGNRIGSPYRLNNNSIGYYSTTAFSDNSFLVVWLDKAGTVNNRNYTLSGKRFDEFGNNLTSQLKLEETFTPTYAYFPPSPLTARLKNDDIIIVWDSYKRENLYGCIVDNTGRKVVPDFLINTFTYGKQQSPSIALLSNDNFIVCWSGEGNDYKDGIFAQIFDSRGNKIGTQLELTSNSYYRLTIAVISNNNLLVSWWESISVNQTYITSMFAQVFDGTGNALNSKFRIDNTTQLSQVSGIVRSFTNGNAIATWSTDEASSSKIFAQQFNGLGNKVGSKFLANGAENVLDGYYYHMEILQNEYPLVVWEGSDSEIYGKILQYNDNTIRVITIGSERTYTEDEVYKFSNTPLLISAGQGYNPIIDLTLTFASGQIDSFTAQPQKNVTGIFDPVNSEWQARCILSQMNGALDKVSFMPKKNCNKEIRIQLKIIDISPQLSPDFNGEIVVGGMPVDDPPVFINNKITIKRGGSVIIHRGALSVSDVDTPISNLKYIISNLQHGSFEYTRSPGVAVTQFTQQDVNNKELRFIHDGSEASPSGEMYIADGVSTIGPRLIGFSFLNPNNSTLGAKPVNPVAVAVPIAVVGVTVIALGIGIWRHSIKRKLENQRAKHPLANRIYQNLNIRGVEDFESTLGRLYVSIVKDIEVKFNEESDYDINNMAPEALNEFSDYIVSAIEENIEITKGILSRTEINIADLKSKLNRIVKSAARLIEKDSWVPRQGVVKEKYEFDEDDSNALEMATKKQLKAPLIENGLSMH